MDKLTAAATGYQVIKAGRKAQKENMSFFDRVIFWGGFAGASYYAYNNSDTLFNNVFGYLADADWAKEAVTSLPQTEQLVNRFVAGETVPNAIHAARELNRKGMAASLDFLGEDVAFSSNAVKETNVILGLLDAVSAESVNANVSIKPSQLGLKLNPDLAYDNMVRLLDRAKQLGLWVRMDMEDSSTTTATLDLYHKLRAAGYDNVGVVIQSYLYRSAGDVAKLVEAGAKVRLCKGAYNEPSEHAFPQKKDTDDNFVRLAEMLFSAEAQKSGVIPAIATHDSEMVQAVVDLVKEGNRPKDSFEFQMLYGVRQELQEHLVSEGYTVRVYLPFGQAWYPYFMRRLAERPANVAFLVSNL